MNRALRLVLSATALFAVAACFPGARAPNVPPQRTLGVSSAELAGKGSSGPFGVVFAGPRGETSDPSEVTIVFNRPMRAMELAGEESDPPAKITSAGGAPKGAWRWLGTSAILFAPEKALPRATEYTVTVPGSTKALDGSVLGEDYVFSFRTALPRLARITPGPGQTHVEPKQTFELRFNQPVDPKEVSRATKLTVGKVKIPFSVARPKADTPMLVKLTPERPLPLATKIQLTVDATLRGLEGPLPSGENHTTEVETYGPLVVHKVDCSRQEAGACAPHGGGHVELSNRVPYKDLVSHVRVEPPIPLKWAKPGSAGWNVDWISLPIDMAAASSYRVVITAGLKDEFGQVLARDSVMTFRTGDEAPSVAIGLQGEVLEAAKAKGRDIPIASLNVDRYELVTAAPDEQGVTKLLQRPSRDEDVFSRVKSLRGAKTEDARPAGAKNVNTIRNVSIDSVLGSKGRGALAIATSRQGVQGPVVERRLVSVTDLAISAKVSRFGSVVLVSRLSDGRPVPSAQVAVRGPNGELGAVTTDASGLATLPADRFRLVNSDGTLDERLVLFARSGDDWTFRLASDQVYAAEMPHLDLAAQMPTFGILFTDRGIYKPGETIRIKGVFRKHLPVGMETPRGREMMVHVVDPQGGTMLEHKAKLGTFGELAVDVPIPATSRLGHVEIDATEVVPPGSDNAGHAASASVDVAAYRPAEFKVAVEPDHPTYIRGDKASFAVRGDYLFGAPMTGGQVRYTVTRGPSYFAPPGTDGLVLHDAEFSSALPDASPRGGKLQNGNGALNEKGIHDVAVGLVLPKQTGPENVSFEAEIEDLSRQAVANTATAIVHPAEFYVGLRFPKNIFERVGATLRAEVAAVEPGGRRRAGEKVQVDLVKRTWQTVTEATGEWGMHYESRAVDTVMGSCGVTTNADVNALASCDLKPSDAGYYIVRAKAADKRKNPVAASYGLYVDGDSGHTAWPVYDGARLDLVTDKNSYEIGDTAKILIKNPFKAAEALITTERQGIHEQRRISITGSMPTIQVPITKEMWPNTFVSVELVKGRTAPIPAKGQDVGSPSYRVGWAELAVNPDARRLKVDVKPAKKELRPGDDVDVDLVVTDRAGKGARADVAFYAVDEGVLMLTGYKTPDPLATFAARRNLSVALLESRDDLARIVRLGRGPGVDKGDEGGGGGEGGVRQDFRTTAFFQPSVVTGNDGKAHVRFKLPDSLTTYRLMAVAVAEDERSGFGQEQIVTSRPLMARPALPRFFRAGDAVSAGVILTSKGLPAQDVTVKLEAKGISVLDAAEKRVRLPANGSIEVKWSLATPTAGHAELAFRATSSGGSDVVQIKREVEVPMSLEAVALYGDTESAVAEQLGNLAAMRSDVGGLDLRVASTALVGLESGVDALAEYPYGCAEQLTSKLVPLVALGDLAKDYGIKVSANTNALADEAIAKILKSQRDDGGFGYWPDSQGADVWITAYALWGLHLAKERGRPVPASSTEAATRWLRDHVAACGLGPVAPPSPRGGPRGRPKTEGPCANDPVALSARAFILDVLAMIGKPDAGYASRLYEKRSEMPLFARALLAHAMVLSKMRMEEAQELVRDAENNVRVTPAGATISANLGDKYAPLLDSEARTTAIVLRSLVAIDPKHPLAARLAKGLLAARRGGAWRSTQENAWALLALDSYRKAQEATVPDFDAAVFFGDQEVLVAPFHERTVKSQTASFAADKLFGHAGQNLAFQVRGKGRLFYEARLRYAKKELPTDSLDRGFYVRKLVRSVKPEALADAMRTIPQTSSTSADASDLVLVDLLVVTPDPREQVVIDDPLPAGVEPVQSALATTARDLAVTEPGADGDEDDRRAGRDDDERASGRTFQSSWYHREFHDDRVLTFVDHMAAGMYHYRYLARATSAGRFVVPPTRAECMYEPEIFGRTGAVGFEVKSR